MDTPKVCKITYGKLVYNLKPHKEEKEQVRPTVGCDRMDYYGEVSNSTAGIKTFKIFINRNLSTKDAEMMMTDIKKYYLGTPLPTYEYMRIPIAIIPDEIIEKYVLEAKAV